MTSTQRRECKNALSTYVWCEDSGAGYQFWKEVFGTIYPDFIVETKRNNTRLRTAAEQLQEDGNFYFLLIDSAADNSDVVREVRRLKMKIAGKNNVCMIDLHSFEFSLLSFENLERWVFAENDELRERRRSSLQARELLVDLVLHGGNAEQLQQLKALLGAEKNTEQIAAKLLFDITRNTGFETDKSRLGPCFINNCCEWAERQSDDICGLDSARITAEDKKKQIVEHSVIKTAFQKVGI